MDEPEVVEDNPGAVVVAEQREGAPERAEPTENDRLREENARLRGENDALTRRPAPDPRPEASPPSDEVVWTPELVRATQAEIDRRWQAGEVDEASRAAAYAKVATQAELQAADRKRRARETAERTTGEAQRRLKKLVDANPDLRQKGSPLLQAVATHLDDLEELGYDAKDPRTQLIAAERAIAAKTHVESDREYDRRRRPVGGGGDGMAPDESPGGPRGKSKGQRLFERMTADSQAFYRKYHRDDLAKIYKTLDYADEPLLHRMGRFAR